MDGKYPENNVALTHPHINSQPRYSFKFRHLPCEVAGIAHSFTYLACILHIYQGFPVISLKYCKIPYGFTQKWRYTQFMAMKQWGHVFFLSIRFCVCLLYLTDQCSLENKVAKVICFAYLQPN